MRTAPTDEKIHDVPNSIRIRFTGRIILKMSQESLEERNDVNLALSLGSEFKDESAQGGNRIG